MIKSFKKDESRWQGRYGASFAIKVQSLLSITRVAVQVKSEPGTYLRLQIWLRALAQCRDTICHGARNISWYRCLIECSLAYPGLRAIRNFNCQSTVMMIKDKKKREH